MKIIAIVQARMKSKRFPNKAMKMVNGTPLIELLLNRLKNSKEVSQVIVATSYDPENAPLIDYVKGLGFTCEQGSDKNVLERFFNVAKKHNADAVVRVTGDCPLIDPNLLDECVRLFKKEKVDYFSNSNPPTYPDGLDVEVIKISALEIAFKNSSSSFEQEHVTPHILQSNDFVKSVKKHNKDLSDLRWTVDEPSDFQVIKNIFDHFNPNINFSWQEVLTLQKNQPELFTHNSKIQRNEGSIMNTGQKLWNRAKKSIPGGNMLLSKRPEMFLPDQWPTYFSKAKGCKVWDMDENEYIDMSIMGIGTNILGYGHPEVDNSVVQTIQKGNMSTLNCPEEVYLAEKLNELHPWSDMVRFARSGGEANAIAIRIARAASGKDKVAVCGYHGWHDWYLSANLNNDQNLDSHLLPGLEPKGVPKDLKNTVFPFNYNDFDELESLVNEHDIGVIKMEVFRNKKPEDNFLEKVRDLATKKGIVLIFDECTSGFRETLGGLHLKYNVDPDIAMFGKALGNGYAITAILGRRDVMEAAQSTFISSTFWTERTGPTAALKTIEIMEKVSSWDKITKTGLMIRNNWQKLADKHDLKISHFGLPALAGFNIESEHNLYFKTLITQEMLSKGYLAGNTIYVCTEHTSEIIDGYLEALDTVFGLISQCINGRDIKELVKGPVCHNGFKRLN